MAYRVGGESPYRATTRSRAPADFKEMGAKAQLVSVFGSIDKNPTWKPDDFTRFKALAEKIEPKVTCKGDSANEQQQLCAISVPDCDDVEYLWAMNIDNEVLASKRLSPGEKAVLEFDLPTRNKAVVGFMSCRSHGQWKSQPYMKYMYQGATEYEWKPMLSYEKGACHTAPDKAAQWYPQLDRHPDLKREIDERLPMRILYLHGHANNLEIGNKQVEAMKSCMVAKPQIHVLEGNVSLSTKPHFASVIDYSPHLVELGLAGAKGYQLQGYGHIEAPAADPKNDPTAQTNCEGVTWAKMSQASMDHALEKLVDKIEEEGGYDAIIGFSQGGEVVQNLINRIPELNEKLEYPIKFIGLFGTRIYYKKYGPVTAKFEPGQLKAFVCMGLQDNEDTKDATRNTDNLWDLEEFKNVFEGAGIETVTDTHAGGHEMPDMKMEGVKALYTRVFDFYHGKGPPPPETGIWAS